MATPPPGQGSGRCLLVLMLVSRRPPPRAAWAPCPLGAHRAPLRMLTEGSKCAFITYMFFIYLFPSHKELCMPSKQKSMKPPRPRLDS